MSTVSGTSGCLVKLAALLILVPLAELALLLVLARYTSIWMALLWSWSWASPARCSSKARVAARCADRRRPAAGPTADGRAARCRHDLRRRSVDAHSGDPHRCTGSLPVDSVFPALVSADDHHVGPHAHASSGVGRRAPDGRSEVIDSYVIDPADKEDPRWAESIPTQ